MVLSSSPAPAVLRCQGILFDMDGVLISSLGSVERSWTHWAQLRGIDPAIALAAIHGRRAVESVARLRPDLDSAAELKLIEELEIADQEGITLLPGVLELVHSLPTGRWTIVTSATEKLARVRLAAAGVPVPARIITADSVAEGKPNPAPFLAGAALLGYAPQDCIVFEDSSSGAVAGRAAGCTVVATTFSHAPESLAAAHFLIPDLVGVKAAEAGGALEVRFQPLAR